MRDTKASDPKIGIIFLYFDRKELTNSKNGEVKISKTSESKKKVTAAGNKITIPVKNDFFI